ncbi:hypothetical protein [[Clostridium] scindens]|uniref:hypothetical protein n=1 Tax=Clostridium scindens (strain JCM 10418 / VPI 12708) TaxID=29347 RepID=UPI00298C3DFD|nr:hypothetical protein [[Clostridium] scindens]WPB41351.1 hypothetical protein DEGADCKI_02691 [[Clostridium] scindens]
MIKKVTIDYEKLCEELNRQGKTKQGFSIELGRGKNYIVSIKNKPDQPENMENLMCTLLGLDTGILVRNEKAVQKGVEAKALENIYRKLCEIEGAVKDQWEILEKIFGKSNANTIQIEKVKDMLISASETESDRAEKLLTDMMGTGEALAQDIFAKADEMCISRKEIMKAKKKLDVIVATTGYGKNQKAVWRI